MQIWDFNKVIIIYANNTNREIYTNWNIENIHQIEESLSGSKS